MCQAICDDNADEVITKMDGDHLLMDSTGVEISPTVCCYLWQAYGNQKAPSVWLIITYDLYDFVSPEALDRPKTLKSLFLLLYFINYIHKRGYLNLLMN